MALLWKSARPAVMMVVWEWTMSAVMVLHCKVMVLLQNRTILQDSVDLCLVHAQVL